MDRSPACAVHVRRAASGSWWNVDLDGHVISQWPSEFSAVDAGRGPIKALDGPGLIANQAVPRRTLSAARRNLCIACRPPRFRPDYGVD